MLPFCTQGPSVGTLNVETALDHLHRLDIPMVAGQTGGHTGLLIRLQTDTGEVLARALGRRANPVCKSCGKNDVSSTRQCRGIPGCHL